MKGIVLTCSLLYSVSSRYLKVEIYSKLLISQSKFSDLKVEIHSRLSYLKVNFLVPKLKFIPNHWYLKVNFLSQKIYFEVSIVWDNRGWNANKNRENVKTVVILDISVLDSERWLYFRANSHCFFQKFPNAPETQRQTALFPLPWEQPWQALLL